MKPPTLKVAFAWLTGFIIAAAVCYWPGGLALFVVAMWGGFSPNISIVWKLLALITTLVVIVSAVFLLARSIARALIDR